MRVRRAEAHAEGGWTMVREERDVDPQALAACIEGENPPVVLDVRSAAEFAAGHVPGARHVPFWATPWRTRRLGLTDGAPIVVYCGHGPRARLAVMLLRWSGFSGVVSLTGHMAAWRRAGLPEER